LRYCRERIGKKEREKEREEEHLPRRWGEMVVGRWK